jgi:hypothetical protein
MQGTAYGTPLCGPARPHLPHSTFDGLHGTERETRFLLQQGVWGGAEPNGLHAGQGPRSPWDWPPPRRATHVLVVLPGARYGWRTCGSVGQKKKKMGADQRRFGNVFARSGAEDAYMEGQQEHRGRSNHTGVSANRNGRRQVHKQAGQCACMHTHTHTHTRAHAHTHTHINTDTHTQAARNRTEWETYARDEARPQSSPDVRVSHLCHHPRALA